MDVKVLSVAITCLHLSKPETLIDLNDILSPELMPNALMLIESPEEQINTTNINHNMDTNGSWHEAYQTMGFHRKMFNEYLCRNFLAESIIAEFKKPLMSRRVGRLPNEGSKRKSRVDFADIKDNLLSDPGSANYKDWLLKTTTLEDIQRHYEKDDPTSRIDDGIEYEGGEITGYAMPSPQNVPSYPHGLNFNQQPISDVIIDPEKHGGSYDYVPHHVHFHEKPKEEEKEDHGLGLHGLFDVTLTALAFLSFGIFILQVIMCISMNKTQPMMQMLEPGGEQTPEDIRFKRDLFDSSLLNELTKRVLKSIDAASSAEKDDGVCLHRMLCENNKFSRTLEYNKKIFVPLWGLGMSWLSSRLYKEPNTGAILQSLKACALGLANVDCASVYSRCNINKISD